MTELQTTSNQALLAPLHIIRTETVLSKLPIHNLAKTGSLDIQIHRKNAHGEADLRWEVSYSSRYGQPRQLAYKIDTIYINRKIDELGRPIPKVLRLGSLRDIARALDLGGDTNNVRKALRQNAFAAISARLTYRSTDGSERRLEADFTRYSVIFAGEKLPDGRQADSVHLIFNEPYLEVLNSAPMRPLNYDYLKSLPPAAQRFYEIVSYKIFAALKYRQPWARLAYSDCCTFSAMQRYYDYDHFKKQMYKVHRPHLESGYLAKIQYEPAPAAEHPDWMMLYQPGPKAIAEFNTFEKRRALQPAASEPEPAEAESVDVPPQAETAPATPTLLLELTRRGISERQARKLLECAAPDQPVLEQLEWGDRLIARSRNRIHNPPGFYVYLIRDRILPPADFTEARRPVPGPAPVHGADPFALRQSYEEYKREEIDHYIAVHFTPERYESLMDEKTIDVRRKYPSSAFWPAEHLRQVAEGSLRAEVATSLEFVSFENFCGTAGGDDEPSSGVP